MRPTSLWFCDVQLPREFYKCPEMASHVYVNAAGKHFFRCSLHTYHAESIGEKELTKEEFEILKILST